MCQAYPDTGIEASIVIISSVTTHGSPAGGGSNSRPSYFESYTLLVEPGQA